jgi:tripartite-type tricarboxylate transporter receptor subunit TctC
MSSNARLSWRSILGLGAMAAILPFAPGSPAFAQAYPTKPIRLVIPFPPGGVDITGRLLANKMGEFLGQPVVVENRGGANGLIGSEHVARSAPDGYTILLTTPSTHVTAVFLQKSIPYDPVKDFTPLCAVLEPVSLLIVNPSLPVNSVQELMAHARNNPGRLTYSSSGIGSVFHLTGEALKEAANVNILHVPYKGTGPALADVVAGRIDMGFNALSTLRPQINAGKVKVLAVAESRRYAGLPNVPTVGEGVPGFNKPSTWFGFFGPAGMPRAVVQRLNADMVKTANAPDLREKLDEGGFSVIAGTPEEFAAILEKGLEVYGKLVKSVGLKPE